MTSKKNENNVKVVADILNDLTFNPKEFCEHFARVQHRSLQQNLTLLALAWLEVCADENYRFDARNEMSHTVAMRLMKTLNSHELGKSPFA